VSTVNTCSSSCLVYAPFYYAADQAIYPCFVAEDWDEVGSPGATATDTDSQVWNQTCGTNSAVTHGPLLDTLANGGMPAATTSYSTYGVLWTGDGSTKVAYCTNWASGVVSGLPASAWRACTSWSPGSLVTSPSQMFAARERINVAEGPESAQQGGLVWTATSETTYIQRITIWTCSGWRTGPCLTNPVITTHP
jgi:hypothetical protein